MSHSMSRLLPAMLVLGFAGAAVAQTTVPLKTTPDHTVRSTPDTVVWGYFAADIPPVLRIKSGQTVRIDTVSHGGINLPEDPVEFFAKHGVARDEILQDALDIRAKVNRPRGGSAHVLTGPIYIDEAQPGDMLEVRVIALEPRVPYGVNSSGPRTGVLPELLTAPARRPFRSRPRPTTPCGQRLTPW